MYNLFQVLKLHKAGGSVMLMNRHRNNRVISASLHADWTPIQGLQNRGCEQTLVMWVSSQRAAMARQRWLPAVLTIAMLALATVTCLEAVVDDVSDVATVPVARAGEGISTGGAATPVAAAAPLAATPELVSNGASDSAAQAAGLEGDYIAASGPGAGFEDVSTRTSGPVGAVTAREGVTGGDRMVTPCPELVAAVGGLQRPTALAAVSVTALGLPSGEHSGTVDTLQIRSPAHSETTWEALSQLGCTWVVGADTLSAAEGL
jgi:hypothetical protein